MRLVRGVVQHYAWGHPTAIPRLLGIESDGRPWAELWFGTHLGGASKVVEFGDRANGESFNAPRSSGDDSGGQSTPLLSVSGELPFLLKVLAAAEPLSLQSHPSEEQARLGYARENRLGIPVSNSRRIYRDPFAKPEVVCALGRFEALCGFRDPVESVELLHSIGGAASHIATLLADHDLDHVLRYLFSGTPEIRQILRDTIEACANHESPSARWATKLALAYPDDPAVVVSLLLNHVVLQPGEALYLDPGNLHRQRGAVRAHQQARGRERVVGHGRSEATGRSGGAGRTGGTHVSRTVVAISHAGSTVRVLRASDRRNRDHSSPGS